jgi:hypothetical protein
MENSSRMPWQRIAVEGVVIVASILLAFSIDAWWDGKQRQAEERVVLQNLLDDFRIKQLLLADTKRFSNAILESAKTLLRAASGDIEKPDEETIDGLIADTWWVNTEAVWDSAPLDLLDSGGTLSLISNPELVQELAALKVAIQRVKYHARNDGEFHANVMTPFAIANSNMAQISARLVHRPGQPEVPASFPDLGFTRSHRHSELLSTTEFQNVLVAKIERCFDILEVGLPGVEKHRFVAISMLENEFQ